MAESDNFTALVRRLGRSILIIGAIASIGVTVRWGWQSATVFAFGVGAAFLNMR